MAVNHGHSRRVGHEAAGQRDVRRSINACPVAAAYVVYTATVAFSTRPVVPVYYLPAPAVAVAFFN
jgi:hypothetical protein